MTLVTSISIEKWAETWIKRLGLETWDIRLMWPEDADYKSWLEVDDISFSEDQHAAVHRSRDYDSARMYFNPDYFHRWSPKQAEVAVVHELLHLVTRDIEHVLDMVDGMLLRDVEELVSRAHVHAVEGAVDRLAYRLVELAPCHIG